VVSDVARTARVAFFPRPLAHRAKRMESERGAARRRARATDEPLETLRSHVDIFERRPAAARPARVPDEVVERALDRLRDRARSTGRRITERPEAAVGPDIRAQLAFFERIDADDERSGSRAYARLLAASAEPSP
jgi:hypothetical protein